MIRIEKNICHCNVQCDELLLRYNLKFEDKQHKWDQEGFFLSQTFIAALKQKIYSLQNRDKLPKSP